MPVQEQCQNECDEEEYDVHDAKSPGSLKHSTVLVDVDGEARSALSAIVSERSKIHIDGPGRKVGTVIVCDPT